MAKDNCKNGWKIALAVAVIGAIATIAAALITSGIIGGFKNPPTIDASQNVRKTEFASEVSRTSVAIKCSWIQSEQELIADVSPLPLILQ